jgi:hypothetical protein
MEGRALVFEDLWIRHFGGPAQYEWRLDWDAADLDQTGTATQGRIEIPAPAGPVPPDEDPGDALARLRVWKIQEGGRRAPRPATFWLGWNPSTGAYELTGVRY